MTRPESNEHWAIRGKGNRGYFAAMHPDMRILIWYWGRRGAGAQITYRLAEALARREDVTVALSLSSNAELLHQTKRLGLPLDAVPTYANTLGFLGSSLRILSLRRRLKDQALNFGADVIVSIMTHLWTPLIAPDLKRAGLRYFPFIHDVEPHPGDPGLLWEWRLRRELEAAHSAIAFSDLVMQGILRRRPTLPVYRMLLGAPLLGSVSQARYQSDDTVRFICPGRLLAYKGLDLLRDAWKLLHARHSEARLSIVGEGDVETLAPGLSSLDGVSVQTRWLPEDQMANMISSADAVVLPYREASQSGIIAAAHGLGVPVVATPVGALPDQIRNGVDGIIARAVNPEALADALAIICDRSKRAALTSGAQESSVRLNDWDSIAGNFLSILKAASR